MNFWMLDLKVQRCMIGLIIIYRPLSSPPLTTFHDEFSVVLEEMAIASGHFPIVDELNIYVDSLSDSSATHFRVISPSFDLEQWVTTSTHIRGRT